MRTLKNPPALGKPRPPHPLKGYKSKQKIASGADRHDVANDCCRVTALRRSPATIKTRAAPSLLR
ncbi:hypothetical protein IMCC26134_09965 [Verrucomicrobia bacterium IMCC26134]|nr:hypothetical protein IMCC26134_09965 [Verrucomicrobia bacterium IMCC26134]